MNQAINLTQYAIIEKTSRSVASQRNLRGEIQTIVIQTKELPYNSSTNKKSVRMWIHGYKIVKDTGTHLEEVNPCKVRMCDKSEADIIYNYTLNTRFQFPKDTPGYYCLPEGHRFLKLDNGKR